MVLIKNWEELSKVPPSETHYILIDTGYSGWVKPLNAEYRQRGRYLSTYTFYEHQHERSTKLLQSCGFDVEITNNQQKR